MDLLASVSHSGGLSLDPIAKPIAWILAHIYAVVPNYGVAILVLSVIWMALIAPLTLKTTRSMLAMQKLQPEIKKLQDQHRNDRAALSQATMDLYKEKGVSPFGSCLPTLLPLPIFFALFRVIDGLSHTSGGQAAPKYLAHSTQMYKDILAAHGQINAFGVDLAKNALSAHSGIFSALPYFLLILVMMGTQYLQTVQMMNRNPANADNPQAKLMKFLPLIFGLFMVRFPAGVVLYYGMSNVCRIAQQTLMYRYDPKVKALAVKDIQEVEAETRDIEAGRRKREPTPPTSPPTPRSRFRDLLASAAEQRAKAKDDRAPDTKRPSTLRDGSKPALRPPAKPAGPNPRGTGKPPPTNGAGTGKGASGSRAISTGNKKPQGAKPKVEDAKVPPRSTDGSTPSNGSSTGGSATNGTASNGTGSTPAGANGNTNGSTNGNGNGANRPRTGAGAGGRTGADRNHRTNRKRRGR